jgi:serine/threonine protein kinase
MSTVRIRQHNYNNIKQHGGVLLGSGGFGCVLEPHINCKNKKFKSKNLVSKVTIIKLDDDDDMETLQNEIEISNIVKKIDKTQEYLSPIIDYCKYNYDTDRNDIKNVNKSKMGSTLKHRSKGARGKGKTKKKIKKCLINKNPNYLVVNLILKNSGFDLTYYMRKGTPSQNSLIKKYNKDIIKNLISGLEMLHKNHICHKDIKPHNICIDIKQNYPHARIIDFGLSENLKSMKHTYNNINNSGTPCYMSIDFIILQEIKYQGFDDVISSKKIQSILANNLFKSIKNNLSSFSDRGLNRDFLNGTEKLITKKAQYNTKHQQFISYEDICSIIKYILDLHKNKKLLSEYFKKMDGINTLMDVYSLGLVFFDMCHYFKLDDIFFINLIKNMLQLNYINRINVTQCLKHQYITN